MGSGGHVSTRGSISAATAYTTVGNKMDLNQVGNPAKQRRKSFNSYTKAPLIFWSYKLNMYVECRVIYMEDQIP